MVLRDTFFSGRFRRTRRAAVLAATAALALSVAAPTAGLAAEEPPSRDPAVDTDGDAVPDIESARQQVVEILQKASETASDYREAEAEFARVEADIAELEAEIPRLRAEVTELEAMVRNRAVEAYVGHDAAAASVLEADSLVDASRRAHLIDQVNRHDHDVAAELTDKRKALEEREQQLEAEQVARQESLEEFGEQAALLSAFLVEANAVLRKSKMLELWDALVQQREADLSDPLPLDDAPDEATPEPEPDLTSDPGDAPVITNASECPIDAPVFFTNDWGNPRSGGRTHKGTDVFAENGTSNVAADDGVVSDSSGGLGGIALDLVAEDGTRYYYAHLESIEPEVIGTEVEAGDVIGYTGSTGNASPTASHTHFQLHPDEGEPVNPYFTLFVLCSDNFQLPAQ